MWIVNDESSQVDLAAAFQEQMHKSALFQIPGVHDGMSALYAKKWASKGSIYPEPPFVPAKDCLISA